MERASQLPPSNGNRVSIVVDTREQLPYQFDRRRINVSRRALPAGDYSLDGRETEVSVERKSLSDFVGSVIQARDRFEREIVRLSTYRAACIVIEADMHDVLDHRYRSHAHPHSVIGSAIALFVDHKVPFLFCSDRETAGRFTAGYLTKYHKRMVGRG